MTTDCSGYGDGFADWRNGLFLRPDGDNADVLVELIRGALDEALSHQGAGPVYPRWDQKDGRSPVGGGHLLEDPVASETVLSQLRWWLAGSVKVHHHMFAKNVVPPPSFVNLAALCAVSLFMPNGVTGEDAAETLTAELSCAQAMARLAGMTRIRQVACSRSGDCDQPVRDQRWHLQGAARPRRAGDRAWDGRRRFLAGALLAEVRLRVAWDRYPKLHIRCVAARPDHRPGVDGSGLPRCAGTRAPTCLHHGRWRHDLQYGC